MTPQNKSNEWEDESQLEAIVQGVKEIKEKLAKIYELIHDNVVESQPYDNNWVDLYDLGEEE